LDLAAIIEKTRRDLLELSARNRLVHTPLDGKRKSWVQIVQERSDSVFDLLVKQNKSLSFLGVQEQTAAGTQVVDLSDNCEPLDVDADSATDAGEDACHVDLNLQTALSEEKLQAQLLRFFHDARTAEEEQGVSILYLACGFLKWRESSSSAVDRYAPLLLIPVELSRNTALSKFRLRFRDDEIVTNLSIQARLVQDFGVCIPDLPEGLSDDESWRPTDYFKEIRKLIAGRDGWQVLDNDILLWFFSFTKFLMFRDLSAEAWPEACKLTDNLLIRGLLADGFGAESTIPPLCSEDEPIDHALNPADVVHVTDADSSQAVVIAEIAKGRNLVVQGPPGTGKSQTITNAIAAAVHAGKRVLFVSEKMAALEVVKRRLDNIGLGPMTLELHSHKARKREVLEDLKATIEQGVPTGTKRVPLAELRASAIQLRKYDAVLHEAVGACGVTPFHAMGRLLGFYSSGFKSRHYEVPAVTQWTPEEIEGYVQVANELDQLLGQSGIPAQNPWYGASCRPPSPADLKRLLQRIESTTENLLALQQAGNDVATQLGMPAPNNVIEVAQIAQLASYVRRCPEGCDRQALASAAWTSESDQLPRVLANTKALKQATEQISGRSARRLGRLTGQRRDWPLPVMVKAGFVCLTPLTVKRSASFGVRAWDRCRKIWSLDWNRSTRSLQFRS
jgi:hypothetical protein